MKLKFAPEIVKRYYLVFDSKREYKKALDTCIGQGLLYFSNDDPDRVLAGRFVRASDKYMQIEVDAAVDQY